MSNELLKNFAACFIVIATYFIFCIIVGKQLKSGSRGLLVLAAVVLILMAIELIVITTKK
jgi:hypothetical protein